MAQFFLGEALDRLNCRQHKLGLGSNRCEVTGKQIVEYAADVALGDGQFKQCVLGGCGEGDRPVFGGNMPLRQKRIGQGIG